MTYHRQPSPRRNANPTNGPRPGPDAIIGEETMVRNTTQAKSATPVGTTGAGHVGTTPQARPDEIAPERDTKKARPTTESRAWPAAAIPMLRHPKVLLSLRIDHDIVASFREQGPGYQTRMNAVLRAYVEHVRTKDAKDHY